MSGRPWIMHTIPSFHGSREYGVNIDIADLKICENEIPPRPMLCSELIRELCMCIIEENHIEIPSDAEGRRDLYLFLKEDILQNV